MKNALCYLLVFLGIQMVVAGLLVGLFTSVDPALMQVIATAASALITITLFVLLRWATPTKDYSLSSSFGIYFWCFIAAIGAIVPSVFVQELITWPQSMLEFFHTKETEEMLNGMMATTGGFFVIAILQPLAEELVFRGAILRSLLIWKPQYRWLMICLSALLFALAHMNPMQFIHPFLVGLLLGWMYERTSSIIPGVVYHWVNNTAATIITIVYEPAADARLSDLWGSRIYLAVAFSLLILLPALYQLNLRLRKPEQSY